MDGTSFMQSIINGLMIGGVYALFAVGLTIIFGVMDIVNFAHGEFLMLGMYLTWALSRFFPGVPYWLIIIVAPIMYVIGYFVYKLSVAKIIGKGHGLYILLTLGIGVILQNGALLLFSSDYRSINSVIKSAAINYGHFTIPTGRLIAFIMAIVCVIILNFFLNRTNLGRAMRATGEKSEVAKLLGINTEKTFAIAFGLGIMLAGISGLLLSPIFYTYPRVGVLFQTTAFVVVVLGGMGNVVGALIGGLIIGVMEALTGAYISLDLSILSTFVIFLLLLFFRPYGLFGKARGI
ncbi:MAG TPA: branched-chain amino acid ABC transporter permease [Firmicutes bacterium]|jgi:branched-chain amino acid transport system permease protein|nr:branched-chain amino acid ABC transporter permease [Bacillota bacterium]